MSFWTDEESDWVRVENWVRRVDREERSEVRFNISWERETKEA
jgi:hypothetical protein